MTPQQGEVWRHRYSPSYWLITDRGAVYLYGPDQRPGYSLPGVVTAAEYVRVAESPAAFFRDFQS